MASGYALTIFLSAFLLFLVQPLLGKHILPWFGGGPAVWTVCLLFFQATLLVGYAYAHALVSWVARRWQPWVHGLLLLVSVAALPLTPDRSWALAEGVAPAGRILGLLLASVGAPYALLSATGPLLQAWFAASLPGRSPYRLYALSNLGSFLALLAYPFLIEPLVGRTTQGLGWSVGYGLFVACCVACAWAFWRTARQLPAKVPAPATPEAPAAAASADPSVDPSVDPLDDPTVGLSDPWSSEDDEAERAAAPAAGDAAYRLGLGSSVVLWLALAAVGTTALMAMTNQICQDTAVVPFLWVLPLGLYLLSFVLAFGQTRWYLRAVWFPATVAAVVGSLICIEKSSGLPLLLQVGAHGGTVLTICMTCHGELARARPPTERLTLFYLCLAAGGALGGAFVALAAPRLFVGFWEMHLAMALGIGAALVGSMVDPASPLYRGRHLVLWIIAVQLYVGLIGGLGYQIWTRHADASFSARSFFGALRVVDMEHPKLGPYRSLRHGHITHGVQYDRDPQRYWPVAYYAPDSGAWVAIEQHPRRRARQGLRIGVVGLGSGSLAALASMGDVIRFYEIDPLVARVARTHFTYWSDTPAEVQLVVGDARISMEEELATSGSQRFDVLLVDAFSSDSIPAHLLTREAALLYGRHLRPDGILALHISNLHLRLEPVALGMAETLGWEAMRIRREAEYEDGVWTSTWVLISANRDLLDAPEVTALRTGWPEGFDHAHVWSDEHTSLLQVLQ